MKTDSQPPLPGLAVQPLSEELSLRPAAGREQPAVWVAKLAVYKDWPPSPETLLRQVIELRRGLNILWAQPKGAANEASRLSGHGAGKTTFCRLIRYVLGEEPAGTKAFREAFRAQFDNGWVLAEVMVEGERWLVGRPLSHGGHHPFAKLGGSLQDTFTESASRLGFKDYLATIDKAVFSGMRLRTLADSQHSLDWPRLLPWLSRDQEAHFTGLLEWRHKDSGSESPDLSAEDKANLIRLTLGLVDQEEQDLLRVFSQKSQAHEQRMRDRPKLEFTVQREKLKLEEVLGIKIEEPDAPLLAHKVDELVKGLRNRADEALKGTKQNEEIDNLLTEVSKRRAEWGIANAFVEELEEEVEIAEARLKGVQPIARPQQKDPYREALKGLGPFPGYCSHPMTKAWEVECPIAHERAKDDEITDATKQIAAGAKPDEKRVAALKVELERRRKLAGPKKTALDAAFGNLARARAKHQGEIEKAKAPSREAANVEALLTSYRTACKDLVVWDDQLTELKSDKEKLDARLAELTELHKKLMGEFGRVFNHIAQQMLGNVVTGSVRFQGKSILPELDYHGRRDSAALKVVRWLAFDLAALALGMTNVAAHHPRFLMHDSPRESDLTAAIYASLFTAARELELACDGEPAFQYIVTTTEPPPDELSKAPWLLKPVLDASVESQRLLGLDL